MSIACLSWVMKNSEAQLGARLVLFVLAEHAYDDGTDAYPSVDTLSRKTRLSRRSVQAALRKLEADSMIANQGKGPAGTTRWAVLMDPEDGGADSSPPQNPRGEDDDGGGRSPRPPGGEAASPEPSFNHPEPSKTTPPPARVRWEGATEAMQSDGEVFLGRKRKVAGRVVTEREMALAAAALSEFNRQLESRFELGPWLALIVARVRDHPSWDADAHMRLVRSAFRIKWWTRRGRQQRAKPPVIWSEGSFPNVVDDATREAEVRREIAADRSLHDKVYPGNRAWDDLTRAEQENYKESAAMNGRPWEANPDADAPPAPKVPVANGRRVYTADNFLDGP